MSDQPSIDKNRGTSRRALPFIAGTALAVGAAFGIQALTDSKAYAHMKQITSSEHGRHGDFAKMSDTEIEARISRMVKHLAIEIDATDEQSARIATLVTAVAKDMRPIRDQVHATAREIRDLLLSDTIDREAMEQIRAERIAEADRLSRNLLTAAADVAEVLTPEQRKVLEERMQEFGHKRRGWHRG